MRVAHDLTAHLRQLEAESIHIIREVGAEFRNPVMLYSIGKDSSVMLRLAQKAFYPGRLPFPLLHVNTTWKFRDMIAFRDRVCREQGLELIEYVNQAGLAEGIERIRADYSRFAAKLGIPDVRFIPLSALTGENVVARNGAMPWYLGPTLLRHLETLDLAADGEGAGMRFPVQYVVDLDLPTDRIPVEESVERILEVLRGRRFID